MSLSFESILDRTTPLGSSERSDRRRESGTTSGLMLKKDPSAYEETEAMIGHEDATRRVRQAMRTANAGITLIQIADGSLTEITAVLQDIRALADQASQDLRDSERVFFEKKMLRLFEHIDSMAKNCAFEDFHLLNGAQKEVAIHIEFAEERKKILLQLPDLQAQALGLNVRQCDVSTASAAQATAKRIDSLTSAMPTHKQHFSLVQTELQNALHALELELDNNHIQSQSIGGADLALRTATVLRECISSDADRAIAGQIESLHHDAKHLVS